MPTKLKKDAFTKAFTKTKLGFHLDREIAKGEFIWNYKYEPKLEDNAWHPSGHCTPTLAELYHYAKDASKIELTANPDEPREIEAGLSKIFQVGHFWHQYLQEICLKAGFCEESAIERRGRKVWKEIGPIYWGGSGDGIMLSKPFHWATGSGDIAPCNIPGHGEYLVDFKTMGSHVFKLNKPHDTTLVKWECQLNVYMDFFDLERAMIVGINKDTPHDFKEFEFHRNQDLVDKIYYKWKLVSQCLDDGVEPPEDEIVELPTKGPVNV